MSARHHRHPGLIVLVALGGAAGTLARYGLSTTIPAQEGWPVATLAENLTGAFLLGVLLESLIRAGDETPRLRMIRLGLGTGVLGGFTTFSTLALETQHLLTAGSPLVAIGYLSLSVVGGFLTALTGVVLAARHHHWRTTGLPAAPDQPQTVDPPRSRSGDRP